MRTRARHILRPDTVQALLERRNGTSLRGLAVALGFPASYSATLSDVLRGRAGAVTLQGENELRLALGLPVIETALAPVCPHHGVVHAVPDCGGGDVVCVVALTKGRHAVSDGHVVRLASRCRETHAAHEARREMRPLLKGRKRARVTRERLLRRHAGHGSERPRRLRDMRPKRGEHGSAPGPGPCINGSWLADSQSEDVVMARTCTVCAHPQRVAIEQALVTGSASNLSLSAKFGVSECALRRHMANHLPRALAKAMEAADIARAGDLLDQVRFLQQQTLSVLAKAAEGNELRTELSAIREARRNLELLLRMLDQAQEAQANLQPVANGSEWSTLRGVILAALEPYPEARVAVAEAIKHVGPR